MFEKIKGSFIVIKTKVAKEKYIKINKKHIEIYITQNIYFLF